MKYVKTFENFNQTNENVFSNAWNWIKNKLTNWYSNFTGDFKRGCEWAINWAKENIEEIDKIKKQLANTAKTELEKLWKWISSLVKNPIGIESTVQENLSEEDGESLLNKIARLAGVSILLLSAFGSVVAIFTGLLSSNGFLMLCGAVVAIIAFSIINVIGESTDDDRDYSGW